MSHAIETSQPANLRFRDRCCSICAQPASTVWMPAKVDFSALDGFAFASRKLPEYMHFALALCTSCDLVFANHVPDDEWFQQSYTEADFDATDESSYAATTYGKELNKRLSKISGRARALDIGAGDGAFVAELLKAGFQQVVGVEPSKEPVKRAPEHLRPMLVNDFFRAEDFEPQSFDLITCFQTLEHVEQPNELFQAAHRLLKPGGALMTVAHNFRAPLARAMGAKSPIYDIEHLQLFSPQSLNKAYAHNGYTEIEVSSIANAYPISYWLKLFPMPQGLKRSLLNRITGTAIGKSMLSARVGNILGFGIKR